MSSSLQSISGHAPRPVGALDYEVDVSAGGRDEHSATTENQLGQPLRRRIGTFTLHE